jgi:hypothetical protein
MGEDWLESVGKARVRGQWRVSNARENLTQLVGMEVSGKMSHGNGRSSKGGFSPSEWNAGCPGRLYRYEANAALRSVLRDDPNASRPPIAETLSISRRRFTFICRGLAIP